MSEYMSRLGEWSRRWWVLVLLLLGCGIGLWVLAPDSSGAPDVSEPEAPAERTGPGENGFLPESGGAAFIGAAPRIRETQEDKSRELIAEHEARIAENPDSEDTPALLMATGNLYKSRLGDYALASYYYRTLIAEHTDFPQLGQAYVQLCDCYAQLKDERALRLMCREMLRRFPPESQEHLYAQGVLEE